MGCGCSCGADKIEFRYGHPLVSGKVTPCHADGGLFRVIDGKKWYYYNDTQDAVYAVTVEFFAGCVVTPLGQTTLLRGDPHVGPCTYRVEVRPLDTVQFVEAKTTNGYRQTDSCQRITTPEEAETRRRAREKVQEELQAMHKVVQSNKKITNEHFLLKYCRKKNKKFIDVYFPPTDQSLVRRGYDTPEGLLRDPSKFCWRRPAEYLPPGWEKKLKLFEDGIEPNDIHQGSLGDCYFLCSVAALAEYQSQVEAIFKNDHWCCIPKNEQRCGAYRVTFNVHGWWRTFIVDDYLPSTKLLPAFAQNRGHPNELWISLLEKAYAKAYGSYQAIVAGFPWQALEDLTGFPTYSFEELWKTALQDQKAEDKLFSKLAKWSDEDYLISISTPTRSTPAWSPNIGLALGHAYTVLNVKHFPLHRLCLLKIRNPWGTHETWNGDWGPNSKQWDSYPLIRAMCKPDKKANGTFWMEWKDVVKQFDTGCVCFRKGHWYSKWYDYRVPGTFEQLIPNIALEVVVGKTSFSAYITLHQKDRRGLKESDPDNVYTGLMLHISKGDLTGQRQSVDMSSTANPEDPSADYLFQISRSVGLHYKFEKNTRYFIIPRRTMNTAKGETAATKRFILSMVSSREFSGKKAVVNIVQLPSNCAVFRNVPAFDTGSLKGIKTVYQKTRGNNLFKVHKGTSFNKGTTEISAKYRDII